MEKTSALPPNRSISLPSRLHPTSLRAEAELNKLRVWEARLSSSSETLTAKNIQTGLVGLSEVYRCVEELVYSSLTQQALLSHGKVLEHALDHSVKLLDTCGVVRDAQRKMKEHALRLQSSLRRRGTESRFEDDLSSYIRLRKKLKKEASKCIRSLKGAERKFTLVPLSKDYHLAMVVKVLREVNLMTSLVLRSLLLFLSSQGTAIKNRHGRCSFIAKLKPKEKVKKIINEMNEVGSVDDALYHVLHGTEEIPMAHRKLENLVISIDCIEAGLDVVFRRLIQYRVSILNVLTK
ncbi:uncharacterized protein LOC112512954 [Cynara cardunculus var. scolymus]|uniref:DUF241 domain protein n=1 Tax=Cynara cardunculus var. scolymus TaxID=59895 RepID=A0A103Y5L9_CYNCS|nr:uncharacterized protein LOC112512954 [Cynara cardunculus var. scolymus]KVI02969.1 hypothetical protein Ccrd_018733 [Cynara cardunculus var. scolymus]